MIGESDYNHGYTVNKMLEYMAFGKAQVMFDLREGRESAGNAVRYVPVSSAVELARAIADPLADEATRQAMGLLGAERLITHLSRERSVIELYRAYDWALVAGEDGR